MPDFDRHTPGFNDQWHNRIVEAKKQKAKKLGQEYKPEVDQNGEEKKYNFNYGDFVAEKVRVAKLKKGKTFTASDFKRISNLVNTSVAQH